MCLQFGRERIVRECFQCSLKRRRRLRVLFNESTGCPHKGGRLEKASLHFMISRISSSGVAGKQPP
jgi:hypothetical protein